MGEDQLVSVSGAVLVGVFSGIAGSIIGPLLLRSLGKSDRAIEERRKWVREKMKWVFGAHEEYSTDGPIPDFPYLVPPTGFRVHKYDMHTINPSLKESFELRLLQPRRSATAQRWLEKWMWVLQGEYRELHRWHDSYDLLDGQNADLDAAESRYQGRLRRVQSSLAQWSIGNRWTLILWISALTPIVNSRRKFVSRFTKRVTEEIAAREKNRV